MIRLSLETIDTDISVTHKTSDPITWPEIISLFADLLNGATYVIDKEILDQHLNAAADEMREAVNEKYKIGTTSSDDFNVNEETEL